MAQKLGRPHNFRALSKPKQIPRTERRHYWPYMPMFLLMLVIFFVSLVQPIHRRGVLGYATAVSASSLLEATNSQRGQNGAGALKLNSNLALAAQAKAEDMVARNYWSHTTPDGKQPWVFVETSGYKYQKAGENLAYGFLTSEDTVTGWMNSASHKANMLDTAYSEVGFGFANSASYNNDGEQTVVVAMYAQPQVLAASNQAAPPAETSPSAAQQPVATPGLSTAASAPVSAGTLTAEPASTAIARIQTLTGGDAPWALFGVGLLTGLAMAFLLAKHAAGIRHLLRDSERFVLHHPLLDFLLLSTIALGSFLSQTSGFIR